MRTQYPNDVRPSGRIGGVVALFILMGLFTREGCSFVPNGKAYDSCVAHDVDYKDVYILRQNADLKFLENMNSDAVNKFKAKLYFYGVRLFGRLFV